MFNKRSQGIPRNRKYGPYKGKNKSIEIVSKKHQVADIPEIGFKTTASKMLKIKENVE